LEQTYSYHGYTPGDLDGANGIYRVPKALFNIEHAMVKSEEAQLGKRLVHGRLYVHDISSLMALST
jgi:hypothetical protein